MLRKTKTVREWRKRPTLGAALLVLIVLGTALGLARFAQAQTIKDKVLTPAEINQILDKAIGPESAATQNDRANLRGEIENIPEVGSSYYDTYITNAETAPPPLTTQQQQQAAADAAKEAAKAKTQKGEPSKTNGEEHCGGVLSSLLKGNSLDCTLAFLMNKIMWLSARLLWIAGILFNATLDYTLNFGELLDNLPIVDIGWKILRDIANIVFIFLLLWCGISITLGIGDNGKKAWGLIAQIVLVALFMNFSLLITKAVVDASNIAALHFYRLIDSGDKTDHNSGLSTAFMNGLRIQTLYGSTVAEREGASELTTIQGVNGVDRGAKGLDASNILLLGLFGSLFMLLAGWVFLAATLMFIYRAIVLIMLMLLSPLAFVGFILPGASGMAHEWWHKLWSQAFFAPLYMALAYVVVETIQSPAYETFMKSAVNSPSFSAAITSNSPGSIAIIFNFLLLIGLIFGCLMVAQSLGAKGSEMAIAGFKKLGTTVAGATVRGTIKAPSAFIRGAGGLVTGAPSKAIGNWMASSRLLHNKYWSSDWAKKKGEGLVKKVDTKMESGKGRQFFSKVATKTGNALDVRHLEERASQSVLGNTFLGKAARAVTIGALANAPIGDKSLQEAYKETQHDKTARNTIRWLNQARGAGSELKGLRGEQNEHQNERFKAEKDKKRAEDELALAQEGLSPQQLKDAAEAETELAKAKEVPTEQQEEITHAEENLANAAKSLAEAEKELAKDPANALVQATVKAKQKDEAAAKEEVKKKSAPSPERQQRIEAAQTKLSNARTRQLTPTQVTAIQTAQKNLEDAKADTAEMKELRQSIASWKSDIAEVEERLKSRPGDATLLKEVESYKKNLEQDTADLTSAETIRAPQVKATEKALEDAKKPTLTPEQQTLVSDKQEELNKAAKKLEDAAEKLKEFNKKKGSHINELTKKKQEAYAQISSHEYITYATKEDLINLPDFEDMPLGHYTAATEDEERLTEREKETMTENFLHRLIEISKRGELKNEWYNKDIVGWQKFLNKKEKLIERIAPELRKEVKELEKRLAAKMREMAEKNTEKNA